MSLVLLLVILLDVRYSRRLPLLPPPLEHMSFLALCAMP